MYDPCTLLHRIFYKFFFLTGAIPVSLGNCINLTGLNLHKNKLEGICRIHHTKLLQISITRFFVIGPIPETIGNCIELKFLNLSDNELEGACRIHSTFLPPELWFFYLKPKFQRARLWTKMAPCIMLAQAKPKHFLDVCASEAPVNIPVQRMQGTCIICMCMHQYRVTINKLYLSQSTFLITERIWHPRLYKPINFISKTIGLAH